MATLSEILSPSMIESSMQQGASSPYASMLQGMGYNWMEGDRGDGDSSGSPSGWFMSDTGWNDGGRYTNPYGSSLANMYQRQDSETGNWSYDNSYNQALADAGYLSAGNQFGLGSQWTRASPETLGWFNQNYGTNFTDPMSYMNYLYGAGGQLVNDPNHGQLYRPPEGRGINDYVNRPLSYDPPETGMLKWAPHIIGAIATAGMGGYLPGTESIFGGVAGAGGAFGGDIAGTAFAGEGSGILGSSLGDWGLGELFDAPWGVNPSGSGGDMGWLDGILSDTGSFPGEFNPLSTDPSSLWQTVTSGNTGLSGLLNSLTQSWGKQLGWADLLGGLTSFWSQRQSSNRLEDIARQAAAMSDPFASQRGFYQNQLKSLWTDPNFMANNPAIQAGGDILARRNAKLGQLYSGNAMTDIANYMGTQQLNYSNALGQLAGAGFGPGYAGMNFQQGMTGANQARMNSLDSLLYPFGVGSQNNTASMYTNLAKGLEGLLKNSISGIGV